MKPSALGKTAVYISMLICSWMGQQEAFSAVSGECIKRKLESDLIPALGQRTEPSRDPIARIVSYISHQFREGPVGSAGPYFRGFANPNYTEKELIQYFKGNRAHEIQSWDYSRRFQQHVAEGFSASEASKITDDEIARQIRNELSTIHKSLRYKHRTVTEYYEKQVSGTVRGKALELKSATAVPFSRFKNGFAIGYMTRDLEILVREPGALSRRPVGILLKVSESQPRGVGYPMSDEYMILSHVPVKDVEGAFIAVPKESVYLAPPQNSARDPWLNWFYVGIQERNPDGSAKVITVSVAELKDAGPQAGQEILRWSKELTADSRAKMSSYLEQHPELRKLTQSLFGKD